MLGHQRTLFAHPGMTDGPCKNDVVRNIVVVIFQDVKVTRARLHATRHRNIWITLVTNDLLSHPFVLNIPTRRSKFGRGTIYHSRFPCHHHPSTVHDKSKPIAYIPYDNESES